MDYTPYIIFTQKNIMDIDNIYKRYANSTQNWINDLNAYTNDTFIMSPAEGQWSVSQVYDHLARVTEKCVNNAKLCAENHGEIGRSGFGAAIFSLMGSFPPVRMIIKKIPIGLENVYLPKQISKEQAREELEIALQCMNDSLDAVKLASTKHRVKHWAGGWFNAHQWYQSAEMHIRHHCRQKKRLDKFLINKR